LENNPQVRIFSTSPEVKEMLESDDISRTIFDSILLEIQEALESSGENYRINVSLEQDLEVPEWREILISVQVKERNYDEKMKLWESIEEIVRKRIDRIRDEYPKRERKIIDGINENLAIEIEETQF
jgi:uncharacterized protein YajQ (UPF0234 family)